MLFFLKRDNIKEYSMEIILNPIVISVVLLCVLCLCRINVLLALILSALAAGFAGKMPVQEVMNTFIEIV